MANKCISCNNCGHIGWSKNRGSFFITIVLAIFFFVPAIIYEIWRRLGLGVCSNCDSDAVIPSNQCTTHKPSDVGDLVLLFVVGVVGAILLVGIYAIADSAINAYKNRNEPPPRLTQRDLEKRCFMRGVDYYQKKGEYPILNDRKTLAMDKIQLDCKGSTSGKYVYK